MQVSHTLYQASLSVSVGSIRKTVMQTNIPCLGKRWRKFARCNFRAVSGRRAGES